MLKKLQKLNKYTSQALHIEADRQTAVQMFFYREIEMSIQAVGQSAVQASASSVTSNSGSASTTPASRASTTASSDTGSSASTSTASYTVNISSAARALMAEATETSVQTAQQAGKGDQQAQRLLAKEAAAKVA